MPLMLYGSGEQTTPYGAIFDSSASESPHVGLFALKAMGMVALAMLVPWLATRQWRSGGEASTTERS